MQFSGPSIIWHSNLNWGTKPQSQLKGHIVITFSALTSIYLKKLVQNIFFESQIAMWCEKIPCLYSIHVIASSNFISLNSPSSQNSQIKHLAKLCGGFTVPVWDDMTNETQAGCFSALISHSNVYLSLWISFHTRLTWMNECPSAKLHFISIVMPITGDILTLTMRQANADDMSKCPYKNCKKM